MISNALHRQQRILELLEESDSVVTATLPEVLEVTPMTVWRDLRHLEDKGLIRRLRGRVVRKQEVAVEPDFHSKRSRNQQAKDRIAAWAVSQRIKAGDCVALDGGTTVAAMSRQVLPPRVTIVTNSVNTAQLFQHHVSRPAVYCCGGFLRETSGTFIGPEALKFFTRRRFTRYFLSATGVDAEQGITDLTLEDNEVKQAMAANSGEVVLLADRSKLGVVSHMQVFPWRRIHTFVTDGDAAEVKPIQKAAGKELVVKQV